MWVYDEPSDSIVKRMVTYVPGLYKIFDEIIVNAADNKQRDSNMSKLKVGRWAGVAFAMLSSSALTVADEGAAICRRNARNIYLKISSLSFCFSFQLM